MKYFETAANLKVGSVKTKELDLETLLDYIKTADMLEAENFCITFDVRCKDREGEYIYSYTIRGKEEHK